MDDALAVRVGERVGDRDRVRHERDALGGRRRRADDLVERAALHELHRVVRIAVGPAPDLVDRHDRRVLQVRGDQRLAREPRDDVGVVDEDFLERDDAVRARIARAEHAAEPTARELALQLEAIVGHGAEALDGRGA